MSEHYSIDEVLYELRVENQKLRDALRRLRDTPPQAMRDYEAFVLHVSQKALAGAAE